MLAGETVTVRTPVLGEADPFGAPARSYEEHEVGNVLVQPGPASDVAGTTRPDGVRVRYTLHFPKCFNRPLRGAQALVRGSWLKVIGDPGWYAPEMCPGDWNYPVEVGEVDG